MAETGLGSHHASCGWLSYFSFSQEARLSKIVSEGSESPGYRRKENIIRCSHVHLQSSKVGLRRLQIYPWNHSRSSHIPISSKKRSARNRETIGEIPNRSPHDFSEEISINRDSGC